MEERLRAARRDLRQELRRVLKLLGSHLERQRRRGRTSASDPVQGLLIEEGEAEGLVRELAAALSEESPPRDSERAALGPVSEEHPTLPLRRAARAFELGATEYEALLIALAVELDARFARLVAYLNDHVGRTRPTLGLCLQLAGAGAPSTVALCARPALRDGLLELEGEGPLSGLALRVSRDMLARLCGELAGEPQILGARLYERAPDLAARLVLERSLIERMAGWAALAGTSSAPPILITGGRGSGRTSYARAAAGAAGRALVAVDVATDHLPESLRLARREARWHDAAMLLRLDDRPLTDSQWGTLWSGLAELANPILVSLSPESEERAAATSPVEPLVARLGAPGAELRSRLWRALLPAEHPLPPTDLDALAARFQFHPGGVARAVRRALAEEALSAPHPNGSSGPGDAGRPLTVETLVRAARAVGASAMGSLAQKLPLPHRRADLVVPQPLLDELDLALAWMRHRHQVLERWGYAHRVAMGRGLTAVFAGPPGTGKTMAAQVLARDLDLDLYRVDLSQVMSKYIGETEKNLGRLFDEARASGAVLLFDEADALFGKRSQVKDAHDRYANIEIGYLLQRMEEHEGVTVLASNRMGDMDQAFLRRFHFVLDFPMPDRQDRLRIWEGMLPPQAEREPELDLRPLADQFELSGGEIRNVALAAAYMAASEASPIRLKHLKRALRREIINTGRVLGERELQALA